ncbi:signal peptide peptidase SppA [Shinella daejeonensis]|uniref:signal peptide peptidase SppA n=1 Tax=Shinella daejeonensis TaxID=659017 RepID=UPI0020C77A48|nr:signal peptide peptidase SppA [Shinella daejeonensis]MCP8897265.1 signal peptide peptidase SppA [Shinella daejeonensis]
MDHSAIADRRQLRRKLTFWRVAAIVIVLAALFFAALAQWPGMGARDHIARISITGLIQDDRELLERLDAIARNDRAKALIVAISSPGGTTYGGEVVFKALRKVAEKKPVVSDVRTLAASAGYMIATAGDTIVAGESSITGSIGVIFQYPQFRELMDKLGVSLEEIKSAPLKAEPSPFHPASEEARAMIRSMVMDSYGWFVDLVAERRKLPRDKALLLADGSIFTGRQALAAGLVDQLGGSVEIRAYLTERKVEADLPVVDYKPPVRGGLSLLSGGFGELVRGALGLPSGLEKFGAEKLFLDGLVSVWQVDRD